MFSSPSNKLGADQALKWLGLKKHQVIKPSSATGRTQATPKSTKFDSD